jgi:hypothetical protein
MTREFEVTNYPSANKKPQQPTVIRLGQLRTVHRVNHPPPIHKGQPFSVGLFLWGFLRVCGSFCGGLRTSPFDPVARSEPCFALSEPLFSRLVPRQNLEVREHQNFACYKSARYSRTFQAVGWRHCPPGRNHQPVRAVVCVCLNLTGTISLTYTYDDASPTQPVPLPSAFSLFGFGLAGMSLPRMCIARWMRRDQGDSKRG